MVQLAALPNPSLMTKTKQNKTNNKKNPPHFLCKFRAACSLQMQPLISLLHKKWHVETAFLTEVHPLLNHARCDVLTLSALGATLYSEPV